MVTCAWSPPPCTSCVLTGGCEGRSGDWGGGGWWRPWAGPAGCRPHRRGGALQPQALSLTTDQAHIPWQGHRETKMGWGEALGLSPMRFGVCLVSSLPGKS